MWSQLYELAWLTKSFYEIVSDYLLSLEQFYSNEHLDSILLDPTAVCKIAWCKYRGKKVHF